MTRPEQTPADIDIDRERAVTVTFEDGAVCEFPVQVMRAACPCAGCRGTRERGQDVRFPADVAVRDAQLSGAWGLSIDWSDGHSTGIYAWSTLRRWWDAGLHRPMVDDGAPPRGSAGE